MKRKIYLYEIAPGILVDAVMINVRLKDGKVMIESPNGIGLRTVSRSELKPTDRLED